VVSYLQFSYPKQCMHFCNIHVTWHAPLVLFRFITLMVSGWSTNYHWKNFTILHKNSFQFFIFIDHFLTLINDIYSWL
jgi:hypothetical protein